MFTGIIKGIGNVLGYGEDTHILRIDCPLFADRKPALGASIAVDGVCLTVSHLQHDRPSIIGFDLGQETRALTLLAKKHVADLVNIEFSLAVGDPLDGHIVSGHVDGIIDLLGVEKISASVLMRFSLPHALAPLVAIKGSVAINGVSLTVNSIDDESFFVCLVPHTIEHTSFKNSQVGDRLHIETDVLGRYLQRFDAFYTRNHVVRA